MGATEQSRAQVMVGYTNIRPRPKEGGKENPIGSMFVTNHVLSGVVIGRLLERHPVVASSWSASAPTGHWTWFRIGGAT